MKSAGGESKAYERMIKLIFLSYLFVLCMISFWGINTYHPRHLTDYSDVSHNIIPLKTIFTYLSNFHSYNLDTWLYKTMGNILKFIPLGLLLPLIFNKAKQLNQFHNSNSLFKSEHPYIKSKFH